jgi:hypothetical protein
MFAIIHRLFRQKSLDNAQVELEGAMSALVTIAATAVIAFGSPQTTIDHRLIQAGDCYSMGEQKASEVGGALASADEAVQNGTSVCRIIIVVPAQNGERAKRVELIVPKG